MEKKILSAKDSAIGWMLAFAFSQVAVMVFSLIGLTIASTFGINTTKFNNFLNGSIGYFLSMLALDLAMVFVFVFFSKDKQNNILSKPKFLKVIFYVFVAVVSFFSLYPFISCLDRVFLHFGAKLADTPYKITSKNYALSVLSLALIPAICEELIFRGLIFKGLKQHGKFFSIGLSALMFAIFHMSYQQLAYPILFGLLLGVIMYYENNILYTITVHFINNFLSITLSYFNINLFHNNLAYIILAVILLVVFLLFLGLLIFNKNHFPKQKNEIPSAKLDMQGKRYLVLSFTIMSIMWVIVNVFKIFAQI